MASINTKLRQINRRVQTGVRLERLVFIVGAVFFAACTWGAISSMTRNWELEQNVAAKRRELELLRLEVDSYALENQYYASEEYQELSARAKQNKLLDGEKLVYLPKNSEIAKNKHQDDPVAAAPKEETKPSNFDQWLSFLFGI